MEIFEHIPGEALNGSGFTESQKDNAGKTLESC
jgi:hypothetical protein